MVLASDGSFCSQLKACLNHLHCVKWQPISFIFNLKTEKRAVAGQQQSSCFLVQKLFAHFHAVAVKVTVECGIGCLACQDEFFLMPKEMMSMLLTLLFTSLASFGLGEFGLPVYGSSFLPRTLV
jgi:hypothetical protein